MGEPNAQRMVNVINACGAVEIFCMCLRYAELSETMAYAILLSEFLMLSLV